MNTDVNSSEAAPIGLEKWVNQSEVIIFLSVFLDGYEARLT
jgi:hypothetical protein